MQQSKQAFLALITIVSCIYFVVNLTHYYIKSTNKFKDLHFFLNLPLVLFLEFKALETIYFDMNFGKFILIMLYTSLGGRIYSWRK
ncbi:hypothetical protein D6777_03970 [Candidatus Woesearchaeota archaeon]|nr:MAG: hypothetical protein D6777_03970 [Candidatus Woesearchaeota archaeon]